ncbi:MAG: hypothetical protein KBT21_03850 [Treponema sp.]|nr:hypothetical protein [Candidatus Treponema merdequi]
MKFKNILCALICGIFFTAFSSADEITSVNDHLKKFSSQFDYLIPNAITQTNVYADAWIGKFIPSLPMHFALGVDGGISKFDVSELKEAGDILHITNMPSSFMFPTINANAKIGGLFLPFDAGFSVFCFNTKDLKNFFKNIDFEFFTIGGNIRWALLQGQGLLPKWSVGSGFYYSKGSVGISNSYSNAKTSYEIKTLIFETQLSKTIIFFTPFIGFRAIFSDSDVAFGWNHAAGLNGIYSYEQHKTSRMFDSFIPQIFGGVGLKIGLLELDVNASYDFSNTMWTAGTSLRFQM